MTDNEIITTLAFCSKSICNNKCPLFEETTGTIDCLTKLSINSFNLINRQKAEIKDLKKKCEECDEEVAKWYYEYHVLKEQLKTEKMYHRETEKLADKYFCECKRLQDLLDAAIAGQETLQKRLAEKGGNENECKALVKSDQSEKY